MSGTDSKKVTVTFFFIFLAGLIARSYLFGAVPGGLNQDEASMGYDAWALLNFGIDRNGYTLPVYFVAWGSGQNALYTYLVIPFIAVFGLSAFTIRLPALILGTLSVYIIYKITRRCAGVSQALTAAALLAVAPWHIMLSRWSLESNILPAFLLLATYFYISADTQNKRDLRLYISAAFFALSLYAYMPAVIVVPIYTALLLGYGLYKKRLTWLQTAIFCAVLFVIALPILLFLCVTFDLLPEFKIGLLSIPKLTEHRASMISFGWGNIRNIGEILYKQNDGLLWNAIPEFGIVYLFSLPFTALGIVWTLIKKKGRVMLLWLASALAMCAITEVNINRANSVFIPVIFFTALGITAALNLWEVKGKVLVCEKLKLKMRCAPAAITLSLIPPITIALIYVISFALFLNTYFTSYNDTISRYFFRSFDKSIEYASSLTEDKICIAAEYVNMPYIYVLFNQKIPPAEFAETVRYYDDNAAFRHVKEFGRYSFFFTGNINKDTVYIIDAGSSISVQLQEYGFTLKTFEHYTVAYMLQ